VATPKSDSRILREVIVVTGASAGLGRAIIREFARRGASIGLIAWDPVRLASTEREAVDLGGKATSLAADVANYDDVEHAADEVERKLGPIDIWVNNARVTVFVPFGDLTLDEYKRATEVTILRPGAGHDGGTQAHETTQSWPYRPGRFCAVVQGDPVTVGLLWRQACD
jgi:NAD(P)-dependent dehydrogenase (short-subunit alcohol dehydrogenase family)